MSKPTKQGPETTQFQKGKSGNPGGLTAVEREARDSVRKALSAPAMRAAGLAAYRKLLDDANPIIVKDFMDRLAGKVKERLEVSEDPDSVNPFRGLTPEHLVAIAMAQLDKQIATELHVGESPKP